MLAEQDRAYNLAAVMGGFWLPDSLRTDQLFKAMRLTEDQRSHIVMQVRGDETQYLTIRQIVKDIYPFNNGNETKSIHFADGKGAQPPQGDGGAWKADGPTTWAAPTLLALPDAPCAGGGWGATPSLSLIHI